MPDKYHSLSDLAKSEKAGKDYDTVVTIRPESHVAIIAPHGGGIEPGTSELATLIAGAEHNLFTFRGRKPNGNGDLHIASERFEHADCLAILAHCSIAIGIHGCRGEHRIYVGGLDSPLATLVANRLAESGFPATTECPRHLAGRERQNICNRGTRGCGAQLEITIDLRTESARALIAESVRTAITEHAAVLAQQGA